MKEFYVTYCIFLLEIFNSKHIETVKSSKKIPHRKVGKFCTIICTARLSRIYYQCSWSKSMNIHKEFIEVLSRARFLAISVYCFRGLETACRLILSSPFILSATLNFKISRKKVT